MLASSISGIDQGNSEASQNPLGGVCLGVTHDYEIRVGIEHFPDILERFPFCLAGHPPIRNADDFPIQSQSRAFKGCPCPCARLEKCRHDDFPVERSIRSDLGILENRREFADLDNLHKRKVLCPNDRLPTQLTQNAKIERRFSK